ncbi:hypothetical protein HUS70_18005 [Pandoraea nosoerga]|uniref:Type IV pilus biogenesis protein PilP n=1 Tax=Pandoraea nosoerga TaxID=2508296 RepID=A0A5E4S923_9BURK|nr:MULTISPECIES: hypothetical protein [Pandoraea]MBN4667407.1 hypothetical protein [Pandoraea nosoerga]MBN4677381.1 hypothetical protein [Pandoraea nosoerga]MBN4682229.1 hypothetical protein [Pandoraea nosoerga]MBN4746501.1 hypothetical protein [Pandoraea nosoerga]VVD71074.1 hypothetical protein PNO31109_00606 [Pandoraea nosoerga]
MFTKVCRMAPMAMLVAAPGWLGGTTAHAEETIDAFARAHLKASQQAQDEKAAKAAQAGGRPSEYTAAPPRADMPPELLYIYGVENAVVAYVRVDGRYGRSVGKGDRIGEWQVVGIGDDFIDIRRGTRQRRLLLPSAFGAAPPAPDAATQSAQGHSHGDVG